MSISDKRIVLTGGAGLVGQNLCANLVHLGCSDITVFDKNKNNLGVLEKTHPQIKCIHADLSTSGDWQNLIKNADYVVMLQAQIGGLEQSEFHKNNIISTTNILKSVSANCHITHISSSVINSKANDFYTQSKGAQELLVNQSNLSYCILRPTLMFGWFDRKHLGWLSRFMRKTPIFPVPGNGKYLRQPLYVRDFCNIIVSAMEKKVDGETFNISGREQIYYIDIIRTIKRTLNSKSLILPIPYRLFRFLLRGYALFDRSPPFTADQLQALVIDETFELIDWQSIFDVTATPFSEAITQTLTDPVYSDIILEF